MNEELIFICCGSAIITAIIVSICICSYMSTKYNELDMQFKDFKNIIDDHIRNTKSLFNDSIKNIETLLDPRPIDTYIDCLCYDVACYCINQPPCTTIGSGIIMKQFQIGFTRASAIMSQLIMLKVCRRAQTGGIISIITLEELQNMARYGKI